MPARCDGGTDLTKDRISKEAWRSTTFERPDTPYARPLMSFFHNHQKLVTGG